VLPHNCVYLEEFNIKVQVFTFILNITNRKTPTQWPLCQDDLAKPAPERLNQSGLQWTKRWSGGRGINHTISRSSAPRSEQTTIPATQNTTFLCPTNSVKAPKANLKDYWYLLIIYVIVVYLSDSLTLIFRIFFESWLLFSHTTRWTAFILFHPQASNCDSQTNYKQAISTLQVQAWPYYGVLWPHWNDAWLKLVYCHQFQLTCASFCWPCCDL